MPLFADIDWGAVSVVVTAVGLVLVKLYTMKIEGDREAQKAKVLADSEEAQKRRDHETAQNVKAVADLMVNTGDKLDDVALGVEHSVKLGNSTLLASVKREMEADERLASFSATEEHRFRAEASKKHYLQMLADQEKLGEDMKAAADKRARAKLAATEIAAPSSKVAGVAENIEKIEINTRKEDKDQNKG